jgi:2-polyprenyl-3-methyl-5-hydroxy-6-metoxy-1,4-benzoquinol methylase
MDSKTAEYYSGHVKDASELYNSAKTGGAGKYFASSFPSGSSVLDIGCGSGRDMAILQSQGYEVYGIDSST